MQNVRVFLASIVGALLLVPVISWLLFYMQGRQFALRDTLKKANAIIVLAGTCGNTKFLDGKIATAVQLYQA